MEIEIDLRKAGKGKVALIVEDNLRIRRAIASVFLSDGFETCFEADNGREGIELAKKMKLDVIVLDLSMPIMNGLEAASELRKILPNVPIILFTLYADSVSKADASRAGISAVLLKTDPLSALVEKAHELIGASQTIPRLRSRTGKP